MFVVNLGMESTVVALFLIVGSTILFLVFVRDIRRWKLPPGPRGLPVLGNVFQLSRTAWVDFERWKDEYGPLLYLNILGKSFIVLNNAKTAADLLSRRAAKYSDRPRLIVGVELMSGGLHMSFSTHGDTWRRQRRAGYEGLHKDVMHVFHSAQTLEALLLASSLLRDPDLWANHIKKSTASMIMSIIYNLPPLKSINDPRISRITAHLEKISHAIYPGNYLVEFFPWMMYLPDWAAKWRTDAQKSFQSDSEFFLKLYRESVARFKTDEQPSFVASVARQSDRHGLSETEAAWLPATMYGAGAETTTAAVGWFIFAMVHYPEVQKKA